MILKRLALAFNMFFIFSCCTLQIDADKNTTDKDKEVLVKHSKSVVGIRNATLIEMYEGDDKTTEIPIETRGSGTVVDHIGEGASIVLTAEHVCRLGPQDVGRFLPYDFQPTDKTNFAITTYLQILDQNGERHVGVALAWDAVNDACFVLTTKIDVPAAKIATKPPTFGDYAYVLGYPRGIALGQKNVMAILEGRFSGIFKLPDGSEKSILTTHAAPGSSGSSIINKDGSIIGVVTHVISNFDVVIMSPTYKCLLGLQEQLELLLTIAPEEVASGINYLIDNEQKIFDLYFSEN